MKAACNGHVAIAEMLIEAGTDIHVQGQVTIHHNGYDDYKPKTITILTTTILIEVPSSMHRFTLQR